MAESDASRVPAGTAESEHFSPYRADGKLYGFVCVVTGATQPVGRAIVTELAAHGAACIYACSSSPTDAYAELAEAVNRTYPNTKVIGYPYSTASEESTLTLIDDILNAWGRLDVWTSSTTLLGPPSLSSTSPADLTALINTNVLPSFYALKYAPAAMQKLSPQHSYPNSAPKPVPYGSIVVLTSVAATYGGCWGPAFTVASHAALGVVRAGVAVLKGTGVRINAVTAGQVDVGVDLSSNGEGFPPAGLQSKEVQERVIGLERAGRPEEIGRVAGFLASGFSSYITGSEVRVDGGASVMNPLTVPV